MADTPPTDEVPDDPAAKADLIAEILAALAPDEALAAVRAADAHKNGKQPPPA